MTQTLENAVNFPEEQHFFKRGLSWERFLNFSTLLKVIRCSKLLTMCLIYKSLI